MFVLDIFSTWSDWWDIFTSALTLPFEGLKILLEFCQNLGGMFLDFISFIPYPLNNILMAFIPLITISIIYRVVRS